MTAAELAQQWRSDADELRTRATVKINPPRGKTADPHGALVMLARAEQLDACAADLAGIDEPASVRQRSVREALTAATERRAHER